MTSPHLSRLSHLLSDIAEQSGAPRVARLVEECGFRGGQRDDVLCATADELRRRGRDGLASQTAAYRFVERVA